MPQLRPWVGEVEQRAAASPDSTEILFEVQQGYWRSRHVLVKERLRLSLEAALASGGGAPDEQLRRCCGLGLRACAAEHTLYAAFFAVSGAAGARSAGMLAAQLDAIVYPLYDSLRPLVLQQASLEPLCEMVQVVHGEVLQEGVRRSAECAALEGMLERLLQAQRVVAQP